MKRIQMPDGYVMKKQHRVTVVIRADLSGLEEELGVFRSSDPLQWKGAIGSYSGGRAGATRIDLDGDRSMGDRFMVVKPMLRGGLAASFNRSLHFTMGRLLHEARLSNYLASKGVPSVPMWLGRAESMGLGFFRLHIGFQEVRDGKNLLDLLGDEGMGEGMRMKALAHAGQAVRALHDADVFHRDLNLGNLLVRVRDGALCDGEVKIIDLDRSFPCPRLSRKARVANLARLYRHGIKNGLDHGKDWKRCWLALLEGYCGRAEALSRLEEEVGRAYKRSRCFHEWSWRLQGRRKEEP